MAAKKGGAVALQQDVVNDEEWEFLLSRPGLILVDIYSEWCGPCVGMVGNLKKIKVELGGDLLVLATARADTISALERHRNRSEPVWMLISQGQLINLIFGADAPRIARLIAQELDIEVKVQEGTHERQYMAWDELTPEEVARQKLAEEKRLRALAEEERRKAAALKQMKADNYTKLAAKLLRYTVAVFLPSAVSDGLAAQVLGPLREAWETAGLEVLEETNVLITPEMADDIFFERRLPQHDEIVKAFEAGLSQVFLLFKTPVEVIPPTPVDAVEEESSGGIQEGEDNKEVVQPPAGAEPAEDAQEVSNVVCYDEVQPGEVEILVARSLYGFYPNTTEGEPTPEAEPSEDSERLPVLNTSEVRPAVDSPAALCVRGQADGAPALPGLWTPLTPLSKASAMQALYPEKTEGLTRPPSDLPPSRILVWEATRAREVLGAALQFDNAVVACSFFKENHVKLAEDEVDYESLSDDAKSESDRFVVAVSCDAGAALEALFTMHPLHASESAEEGAVDCSIYFPGNPNSGDANLNEAN